MNNGITNWVTNDEFIREAKKENLNIPEIKAERIQEEAQKKKKKLKKER